MQNLIRFIIRNHFVLLFLFLEIIALNLAISHNALKTQKFLTSANQISGFVYEQYNGIASYFSLKQENKLLAEENTRLKNQISHYDFELEMRENQIHEPQFSYQTAEVVKNSVFKENNFITLNKGSKDNIRTNMAVVSPLGVVGVTAKVSENYTTVVSLLNRQMGLSAKLKNTDYFGSVRWKNGDYKYATLSEIPNHVKVKVSDTVVTSGFSAIFPREIIIGTVDSVMNVTENNFFEIIIKLNVDFKNLHYVYVIENRRYKERSVLEEETKEDFNF